MITKIEYLLGKKIGTSMVSHQIVNLIPIVFFNKINSGPIRFYVLR